MATSKSRPNPKDDLQNKDHFISRSEAKELIGNFRRLKSKLVHPELQDADKSYGVIPESEAFNEKSILAILSQPGCVGIRIHYGIKFKKDRKREIPLIHAVICGVDKDGKNIWSRSKPRNVPKSAQSGAVAMVLAKGFDDAFINEDSQRVPPYPNSQPQP